VQIVCAARATCTALCVRTPRQGCFLLRNRGNVQNKPVACRCLHFSCPDPWLHAELPHLGSFSLMRGVDVTSFLCVSSSLLELGVSVIAITDSHGSVTNFVDGGGGSVSIQSKSVSGPHETLQEGLQLTTTFWLVNPVWWLQP